MDTEIRRLCNIIRQTGFDVHRYFGHGHLERVYENALFHRLNKRGIVVLQQLPIVVFDEDGTIVGEYIADLLVEGKIIVELKAASELCDAHVAQLLGYLRASGIEHGMLINFGAPVYKIRKFVLSRA